MFHLHDEIIYRKRCFTICHLFSLVKPRSLTFYLETMPPQQTIASKTNKRESAGAQRPAPLQRDWPVKNREHLFRLVGTCANFFRCSGCRKTNNHPEVRAWATGRQCIAYAACTPARPDRIRSGGRRGKARPCACMEAAVASCTSLAILPAFATKFPAREAAVSNWFLNTD